MDYRIQALKIQEEQLYDSILAKKAINGDHKAFEVLVQCYSPMLLAFILHIVNDYDFACDISQEVFIRLYIMLPSINTDKVLKPWLFRVAHNLCIDEFRSKRSQTTLTFSQYRMPEDRYKSEENIADLLDTSPTLDQLVAQSHLQTILQKAIEALPMKYKVIAVLRYTTNMRFAEVGQVLDMPASTVKTYFNRAKLCLRKELKKENIVSSYNCYE
jgi:RNA polymerase sigma factor (sigma-70 family)